MKRNMELIRQLALVIEEKTGRLNDELMSLTIQIAGYTSTEIAYHCVQMNEAGLIASRNVTHLDSKDYELAIHRLTWAGHDFLDAARDERSWRPVMTRIGGMLSSVSFDVLVNLLKEHAHKLLS